MRMSEPAVRSAFTGPSFGFANRSARALWNVIYLVLFRVSPRPCHAWRALLLRAFGAKLGRGCHIYPGTVIWAPWNLICDDEVGVGDRAILYNQAPIHLGKRVVISQGAHLCTGTHDYTSRGFPLVAYPITVGDHAWIAAEAFVHPGVTIGEGAVLGARSVAVRDLEPWTVYGGHPAKPIKPRNRQALSQ